MSAPDNGTVMEKSKKGMRAVEVCRFMWANKSKKSY